MSANLKSLAYTGDLPWHGEGVAVEPTADGAAMLRYAELTWAPKKMRITRAVTLDGTEEEVVSPDNYVVVRDDTNVVLGAVGKQYTPAANTTLVEMVNTALNGVDFYWETMGSLYDGQIVWGLVKLPELGVIDAASDIIQPYMLVCNGHDGKTPLSMRMTAIRVVCCNTVTAALGDKQYEIIVRHRSRVAANANAAAIIMHTLKDYKESFSIRVDKWQRTKISLPTFFFRVAGVTDFDSLTSGEIDLIHAFSAALQHGRGTELCEAGTAWAGFQAVSAVATHSTFGKYGKMASILDGRGQALLIRATNILNEMCDEA